jgi:hypothetical protein
MTTDSPVSILYDKDGNSIGVLQDGTTYRLQTDVRGTVTVSQGVAGTDPWIIAVNSSSLPIGAATESTLLNIRRTLTDYETRLDYDTRIDSNPVYIGKAAQETTTSANSWTIQKLLYDVSSRVTRVEVLNGVAWDNRDSLPW